MLESTRAVTPADAPAGLAVCQPREVPLRVSKADTRQQRQALGPTAIFDLTKGQVISLLIKVIFFIFPYMF